MDPPEISDAFPPSRSAYIDETFFLSDRSHVNKSKQKQNGARPDTKGLRGGKGQRHRDLKEKRYRQIIQEVTEAGNWDKRIDDMVEVNKRTGHVSIQELAKARTAAADILKKSQRKYPVCVLLCDTYTHTYTKCNTQNKYCLCGFPSKIIVNWVFIGSVISSCILNNIKTIA